MLNLQHESCVPALSRRGYGRGPSLQPAGKRSDNGPIMATLDQLDSGKGDREVIEELKRCGELPAKGPGASLRGSPSLDQGNTRQDLAGYDMLL